MLRANETRLQQSFKITILLREDLDNGRTRTDTLYPRVALKEVEGWHGLAGKEGEPVRRDTITPDSVNKRGVIGIASNLSVWISTLPITAIIIPIHILGYG